MLCEEKTLYGGNVIVAAIQSHLFWKYIFSGNMYFLEINIFWENISFARKYIYFPKNYVYFPRKYIFPRKMTKNPKIEENSKIAESLVYGKRILIWIGSFPTFAVL